MDKGHAPFYLISFIFSSHCTKAERKVPELIPWRVSKSKQKGRLQYIPPIYRCEYSHILEFSRAGALHYF